MSRKLPRWRDVLLQDWHRYSQQPPTWKSLIVAVLLNAGFSAVFLFRLAQALAARNRRWSVRIVRRLNLVISAAELCHSAEVGPGLFLPHPYGVGIGDHCKLGRDVTLYQGVSVAAKTVYASGDARETCFPEIGAGAILYPHVLVYGPVKVGAQAIILGNSVVSSDVPDGAMYGGIPARELSPDGGFSAQDLRQKIRTREAD